MKAENSKMNEPHKCVFNMSKRLDLTSSIKHELFFETYLFIKRGKI